MLVKALFYRTLLKKFDCKLVADEERFELSVPVKRRTLSRGVVSATHPLVQWSEIIVKLY